MKPFPCLSAILLFFVSAPSAVTPLNSPKYVLSRIGDSSAIRIFDRIKGFEGNWKGTYEWSGSRTAKGKMDAKYYLTGNGSALVEDLLVDNKPMMTSIYHLDGVSLRITHFCGAGNQPRLKATVINEEKSKIHFDYLDATNLLSEADPHVCGLDLEFPDRDKVALVFDFITSGVHRYEHIELTRTA